MTGSRFAQLSDVAEVLQGAGYAVASRPLAHLEAVIGETDYALVACVQISDWSGIEESVFDAQAAFTRLADDAPSARTWDLYLFIFVQTATMSAAEHAAAETIEADTRYTRKYVRVGVSPQGLDQALRPLLPLRPASGLELRDPLGELRSELRALEIPDDIADSAMASFAHNEVVEIP